MPQPPAVTDISHADYEAIEAAVMETARGRWFLAEYARRNRHADTEVLLASINRLEHSVTEQRNRIEIDRFKVDLVEMASAIAQTRAQISTLPDPMATSMPSVGSASQELDAIVRTTETATTDILSATEAIQDTAWTMREQGVAASLCDAIDEQATNIYTACSFQDLTAQRTMNVIETLHYLESRINTMIEIWGFAKEENPRASWRSDTAADDQDEHLSQSDIDFVLVERPRNEAANEPAAPYTAQPITANGNGQNSVSKPARMDEKQALQQHRPLRRLRQDVLEKVDQLSEISKNALFV